MNIPSNKAYWRTILLVALLYGIASLAVVFFKGSDEDAVRILIRYSARISALLFSIAFSARAIHYFVKKKFSENLLKNRPHFGLAFTVSHTFHLFFLICLQQLIHPVFTLAKSSSLLAGGMAYLFMYVMAISTFTTIKNKLDPRTWKFLHLLGGYWIWIIFFNSYLKNVLKQERYHILLIILSLVMLLRISQLIHRKIKR